MRNNAPDVGSKYQEKALTQLLHKSACSLCVLSPKHRLPAASMSSTATIATRSCRGKRRGEFGGAPHAQGARIDRHGAARASPSTRLPLPHLDNDLGAWINFGGSYNVLYFPLLYYYATYWWSCKICFERASHGDGCAVALQVRHKIKQ